MPALKVNAMVNGQRLFGSLSGEGKTTVILDAGLGSTSEDWSKVDPAVASFSKVFSYEKAGLGQNKKATTPRSCQDIISDLRVLLFSADLLPPYILVSHSRSAINARWFANQ